MAPFYNAFTRTRGYPGRLRNELQVEIVIESFDHVYLPQLSTRTPKTPGRRPRMVPLRPVRHTPATAVLLSKTLYWLSIFGVLLVATIFPFLSRKYFPTHEFPTYLLG